MEDDVWWTGGEVIIESGFEVFSLEFGLYFLSEIVQVSTDFAAFRIIEWIDSDFNFVSELKHWFNERTFEKLISDFLTHD